MSISAFCHIDSYKLADAMAIHQEAVRELKAYKNPNWRPERSGDNVYFDRVEFSNLEEYIDNYRSDNGISGRYIKYAKNPKSTTNCMCQALFAFSPEYIHQLSKAEQLYVFQKCFDFFKSEFPNVPILEAVIHFDETTPHLHIDYLPVFDKGAEKIFSTSRLMNGKDFFPQLQNRFYAYLEKELNVTFVREQNTDRMHLPPKEFREQSAVLAAVKAEIAELEEEENFILSLIEKLKQELAFWEREIALAKQSYSALSAFDQKLKSAERVRDLEQEVKKYRQKCEAYEFNFGPINWKVQEKLDKICGTDVARRDKDRFFKRRAERMKQETNSRR